jgi:hypothetical protein
MSLVPRLDLNFLLVGSWLGSVLGFELMLGTGAVGRELGTELEEGFRLPAIVGFEETLGDKLDWSLGWKL